MTDFNLDIYKPEADELQKFAEGVKTQFDHYNNRFAAADMEVVWTKHTSLDLKDSFDEILIGKNTKIMKNPPKIIKHIYKNFLFRKELVMVHWIDNKERLTVIQFFDRRPDITYIICFSIDLAGKPYHSSTTVNYYTQTAKPDHRITLILGGRQYTIDKYLYDDSDRLAKVQYLQARKDHSIMREIEYTCACDENGGIIDVQNSAGKYIYKDGQVVK